MRYEIEYAEKAIRELNKLSKQLRKRITDKLYFYSRQEKPLSFARKLTDPLFGEYRFRIGDWRAIFDVDKRGNLVILLVLTVKHRKDVYRGL
jgi:mRNA interferase RelE/StbE